MERRSSEIMARDEARRSERGDPLAIGLGWFSVGLGVAALAAPGALARFIGAPDTARSRSLVRFVGLRELVSGVGVLSMPRSPAPLWGRVAGDVLDLALLGGAARSPDADRARLATAGAAVMGVTMLDVFGSQRLGGGGKLLDRISELRARRDLERRGITVTRSITIKRSLEDVYGFWRDFENLPRFMRHLESVDVVGDGRSRWKTKAPAGSVEWEAELVEDRPNERIAWRSVEGSQIDTNGVVRFVPAPGGRGTEVHVELRYRPPLGKLGSSIAKIFREAPEQQIEDDLHALKQVLETGEVIVSDATYERGPHPARPPALTH